MRMTEGKKGEMTENSPKLYEGKSPCVHIHVQMYHAPPNMRECVCECIHVCTM